MKKDYAYSSVKLTQGKSPFTTFDLTEITLIW